MFYWFSVPHVLERDPLKISCVRSLSIVSNESKQDIDSHNEIENDPLNPPPRVTYLTPPHRDGFGIYHTIHSKPIKFNVRYIILYVPLMKFIRYSCTCDIFIFYFFHYEKYCLFSWSLPATPFPHSFHLSSPPTLLHPLSSVFSSFPCPFLYFYLLILSSSFSPFTIS